jgi:6-phosphogluconolactonase
MFWAGVHGLLSLHLADKLRYGESLQSLVRPMITALITGSQSAAPAASNEAPQGTRSRLTLTLGVINHASMILFLVTGTNKAHVLQQVLERPPTGPFLYPVELVRPESGRLLWYLDRAAATELSESANDPSLR